jgi:hypothetical protein
MSNRNYRNYSDEDRKKLMKNYRPPDKKKGFFKRLYNSWLRLNFDSGRDTDAEKAWKRDKTGFLWAVERGVVREGERALKLNPYDRQSNEILASGTSASTTARRRDNEERNNPRISKKTGRRKDELSIRNEKGQFGKYIPPTPAYKNQPRYKGRFITQEELEKIGQLSVNRTLPRNEERDKENAAIEREFITPGTQRREVGPSEELTNELARLQNELAELQDFNSQREGQARSSNDPTDNRIAEIEAEIERIQQEMIPGIRRSDLPEVESSSSDEAYDANQQDDYEPDPVNETVEDEGSAPLYRVNFTMPVRINDVYRKPIRLSTVISWMKKWTEWRFCDGLNRLYENIKQRPESEFSVLKSNIHKLAMANLEENSACLLELQNIQWAKMFPATTFFIDTNILNKIGVQFEPNELDLRPALLQLTDANVPFHFRFANIRRPLIGQASGMSDTHVILVDNQFGLQLNINQSGVTSGTFDLNREKYKIPQRKLFEMICLMHMYKKKKARYISIFDPNIANTMVSNLLSVEFNVGTIVYKPWFNYEIDSVKTLLDMPKREIIHAIYEACWNLDLTELENKVESNGAEISETTSLIQYHRAGDLINRKRWRPAALGAKSGQHRRVRRLIYEDALRQMKNRYTTMIREWGNVGSNDGQIVLDEWALKKGDVSLRGDRDDPEQQEALAENESDDDELARPLFQLERIDVVFNENEIQRLVNNLQLDINRDAGVAATNGVALILQTNQLAQNIYTALFTKKLRGIKRGEITRLYEDDRYEITWHIPLDVLDGRNNLQNTTVLSYSQLQVNHRRVCAFLLSKIARLKEPLEINGESIVDNLRAGNALPPNILQSVVKNSTEPYTISIDVDGTPNYEQFESYIREFKTIVELKNEGRPCNGKYEDPRFDRNGIFIQPEGQPPIPEDNLPTRELTISKEIKRMLENLEQQCFQVDETRERCVQNNCSFICGIPFEISLNN